MQAQLVPLARTGATSPANTEVESDPDDATPAHDPSPYFTTARIIVNRHSEPIDFRPAPYAVAPSVPVHARDVEHRPMSALVTPHFGAHANNRVNLDMMTEIEERHAHVDAAVNRLQRRLDRPVNAATLVDVLGEAQRMNGVRNRLTERHNIAIDEAHTGYNALQRRERRHSREERRIRRIRNQGFFNVQAAANEEQGAHNARLNHLAGLRARIEARFPETPYRDTHRLAESMGVHLPEVGAVAAPRMLSASRALDTRREQAHLRRIRQARENFRLMRDHPQGFHQYVADNALEAVREVSDEDDDAEEENILTGHEQNRGFVGRGLVGGTKKRRHEDATPQAQERRLAESFSDMRDTQARLERDLEHLERARNEEIGFHQAQGWFYDRDLPRWPQLRWGGAYYTREERREINRYQNAKTPHEDQTRDHTGIPDYAADRDLPTLVRALAPRPSDAEAERLAADREAVLSTMARTYTGHGLTGGSGRRGRAPQRPPVLGRPWPPYDSGDEEDSDTDNDSVLTTAYTPDDPPKDVEPLPRNFTLARNPDRMPDNFRHTFDTYIVTKDGMSRNEGGFGTIHFSRRPTRTSLTGKLYIDSFYNDFFKDKVPDAAGIMKHALHRVIRREYERKPYQVLELQASGEGPQNAEGNNEGQEELIRMYNRRHGLKVKEVHSPWSSQMAVKARKALRKAYRHEATDLEGSGFFDEFDHPGRTWTGGGKEDDDAAATAAAISAGASRRAILDSAVPLRQRIRPDEPFYRPLLPAESALPRGFVLSLHEDPQYPWEHAARYEVRHPSKPGSGYVGVYRAECIKKGIPFDAPADEVFEAMPNRFSNTLRLRGNYNYFDREDPDTRGIMKHALHRIYRLEYEKHPYYKARVYAYGVGPKMIEGVPVPGGSKEEELALVHGTLKLVDMYRDRHGFQVMRPEELEELQTLAANPGDHPRCPGGVHMRSPGLDVYTNAVKHEMQGADHLEGSGFFDKFDHPGHELTGGGKHIDYMARKAIVDSTPPLRPRAQPEEQFYRPLLPAEAALPRGFVLTLGRDPITVHHDAHHARYTVTHPSKPGHGYIGVYRPQFVRTGLPFDATTRDLKDACPSYQSTVLRLHGNYNHFDKADPETHGIMKHALHRIYRLEHEKHPFYRARVYACGKGPGAKDEEAESTHAEELALINGTLKLVDMYKDRHGFAPESEIAVQDLHTLADFPEDRPRFPGGVFMGANGREVYERAVVHELQGAEHLEGSGFFDKFDEVPDVDKEKSVSAATAALVGSGLAGGAIGDEVAEPLSGDEVRKLSGGARIVRYPDLSDFNSFDALVGDTGAAVLFLTTGPTTGHWIAAFNSDDGHHVFDPLGVSLDKEKNYISKAEDVKLGEAQPQFRRLLGNESVKVSKHDFQENSPSVNTCGRWVAVRLRQKHMTDPVFHAWVKDQVKDSGQTPDEWVATFTA